MIFLSCLTYYYETTLQTAKFKSQREYCKSAIQSLNPAYASGYFGAKKVKPKQEQPKESWVITNLNGDLEAREIEGSGYGVTKLKCDYCGEVWYAVRPKDLWRVPCPKCRNMVFFEELPKK